MKIFDCFVFYNELDLLQLRLQTYYSLVDYFVICECSKTQKGKDKPFYFEENKKLFLTYSDKIIHIKADNPPVLSSEKDWAIEFYQRQEISLGLKKCSPEDFIILSDIDEFFNPELIKNIKTKNTLDYHLSQFPLIRTRKQGLKRLLRHPIGYFTFPKFSFEKALQKTPITLQQDFFYYFMNYRWENSLWHGTIISYYKNISSIQDLRNKRYAFPYIIRKSKPLGWHFSYLGGVNKIKEKLNSIIEGYNVKSDDEMSKFIEDCLKNKKDLFGRTNDKEITQLQMISPAEIDFPDIDLCQKHFPQFFYNISENN